MLRLDSHTNQRYLRYLAIRSSGGADFVWPLALRHSYIQFWCVFVHVRFPFLLCCWIRETRSITGVHCILPPIIE